MTTKEQNQETLTKLNRAGFKVNIQYYRRNKLDNSFLPYSYFRLTGTQKNIDARGGLILLYINNKEGTKFSSLSKCHLSDNFCKSLGLSIALSRIPVDNLI
jgi:glucan biosynthesis protein